MPNGAPKFKIGALVRVKDEAIGSSPHTPHDVLGKDGFVSGTPTWMDFGGHPDWVYAIRIRETRAVVDIRESYLDGL